MWAAGGGAGGGAASSPASHALAATPRIENQSLSGGIAAGSASAAPPRAPPNDVDLRRAAVAPDATPRGGSRHASPWRRGVEDHDAGTDRDPTRRERRGRAVDREVVATDRDRQHEAAVGGAGRGARRLGRADRAAVDDVGDARRTHDGGRPGARD